MQNIANDTINTEDLRLEDFFGPVSNVDHVELPPPPESSLPITVSVGPSSRTLLESANAAILAYNRKNGESVFFQDSSLVEVIKDSSGTPLIRELTADRLLSILTRNAYWVDYQTDKDVKLSLPQARMVLTSTPAELPAVRNLSGLYTGVLFTESGISAEPGYHEETGLYLTNGYAVPQMPDVPSVEDISAARALFADLFGEFRFASPVDFENTVLAVLTLIFRRMIAGPVPIWVVDKNVSGAGGTLLCQTAGTAALGVVPQPNRTTASSEEMEKQITSAIVHGRPFVILDNASRGTNWAPDILLTATSGTGHVEVRQLGSYNTASCDKPMTFAVNGINLDCRADVSRRVYKTRLSTARALADEAPFTRSKSELLAFAEAVHPQVVWAAGVFYAVWKAAGCPKPDLCSGNVSEYDAWYRLCGGCMAANGYSLFLSNLHELQTEENGFDEDGRAVIDLLFARLGAEPFSVKAVQKLFVTEGESRRQGAGFEGLLNYVPERLVQSAISGTLTTQAVGRWLREYVDVKFAGCPMFLNKVRFQDGVKYQICEVVSQSKLV